MSRRDPSSTEKILDAGAIYHLSKGPLIDPLDPAMVWHRLCEPEHKQVMSPGHPDIYYDLFEEWKSLSLDTSIEWTRKLKDRLKGYGDVDDFLKWMKEQLRSSKDWPEFDRLSPRVFAKLLLEASWDENDRASQLITGRLWYGKLHKRPELILGWVHPKEGWAKEGLLALRLNAHVLSPKETDRGLLYDRRIKALLPHIFIGIRYFSDLEQTLPVEKCLLLLGDIFILPGRKTSQTQGRCNIKDFQKTKYLLALELMSIPRGFIVLSNPDNVDASDKSISIGRLVSEEQLVINYYPFALAETLRLETLPDHSRTDGFEYGITLPDNGVLDLKLGNLSSKEPELAEVGRLGNYPWFLAMFPTRQT